MQTRDILLVVGAGFLVAALVRLGRDGWRVGPASRAWLLVGVIFMAVAAWLFFAP